MHAPKTQAPRLVFSSGMDPTTRIQREQTPETPGAATVAGAGGAPTPNVLRVGASNAYHCP